MRIYADSRSLSLQTTDACCLVGEASAPQPVDLRHPQLFNNQWSFNFRLEDQDIGSLGRRRNLSLRTPARKMPNGHALRLGTAARGVLQGSH